MLMLLHQLLKSHSSLNHRYKERFTVSIKENLSRVEGWAGGGEYWMSRVLWGYDLPSQPLHLLEALLGPLVTINMHSCP